MWQQKVSKNLLLLGMVPRVVRDGTCAFAFFAAGLVFSPSSLRVCQITTTTTTTTAGVSNHRRRRHAREEKTAGTIGKVVVVVFNSSRGLSSNKKNSKSQNIPLFSLDVKYVGWRKSTHTRTHTQKKKTHRQTLNPNKKSPFGFCRLSSPSSSRFVFSSSRALFFGPTSAREREREREKGLYTTTT